MIQERGFLVLDFGSQLTQLIARRLRELGYYSEIHSYDYSLSEIKNKKPLGIILSGGPSSVYETDSPKRDLSELRAVCPLLGICYGMQSLAHQFGGEVESSTHREYGLNKINWKYEIPGVGLSQEVWMSHGDIVTKPAADCEIIATSESGHAAAMMSRGGGGNPLFSVQFHPEVAHTQNGAAILKYFCQVMCKAQPSWSSPHIVETLKKDVLSKVAAEDHVLVALSGGVDSSVVAAFLTKTLGAQRVHCVFVNNGLLRKNEYTEVLENYQKFGLNVRGVDATQDFYSALKGLTDPEAKRKAIGKTFIEVFEKSLEQNSLIRWLAQGTLYPDVIESTSSKGGPSQTIKSHHNVGGLPDRMKLKLLEPVRELFKDEVRKLGAEIGLPEKLLGRHPFPGPGLAIRVLGEVTEEKLRVVREADAIFIQALRENNLYHKIWQAFCVLLPVKTVGVQGDGRTYENVLSLRAVTSSDGMTADWYPFEFEFLRRVSNEITNKVKGINRVVYDVTSKPPGTIEWE